MDYKPGCVVALTMIAYFITSCYSPLHGPLKLFKIVAYDFV